MILVITEKGRTAQNASDDSISMSVRSVWRGRARGLNVHHILTKCYIPDALYAKELAPLLVDLGHRTFC